MLSGVKEEIFKKTFLILKNQSLHVEKPVKSVLRSCRCQNEQDSDLTAHFITSSFGIMHLIFLIYLSGFMCPQKKV